MFHGEMFGIKDVITFQGTTVEEIGQAFERLALDDYLAFRKKRGEVPDRGGHDVESLMAEISGTRALVIQKPSSASRSLQVRGHQIMRSSRHRCVDGFGGFTSEFGVRPGIGKFDFRLVPRNARNARPDPKIRCIKCPNARPDPIFDRQIFIQMPECQA